jgi:hypothetical protein
MMAAFMLTYRFVSISIYNWKFSSSGHLEAEHPLYDLIFGLKQSPKLGFANNKMAKNG